MRDVKLEAHELLRPVVHVQVDQARFRRHAVVRDRQVQGELALLFALLISD